jgi:hypothetical protein
MKDMRELRGHEVFIGKALTALIPLMSLMFQLLVG